jgi:hypothetical protein
VLAVAASSALSAGRQKENTKTSATLTQIEKNVFWDIESSDSDHESSRSAVSELDQFLADGNHELTSLSKFPKIREVFLKYNSGLPSSAPVERLFSLGGLVMTPRRSRLSDAHFEKLLLLRANKHVFVL